MVLALSGYKMTQNGQTVFGQWSKYGQTMVKQSRIFPAFVHPYSLETVLHGFETVK